MPNSEPDRFMDPRRSIIHPKRPRNAPVSFRHPCATFMPRASATIRIGEQLGSARRLCHRLSEFQNLLRYNITQTSPQGRCGLLTESGKTTRLCGFLPPRFLDGWAGSQARSPAKFLHVPQHRRRNRHERPICKVRSDKSVTNRTTTVTDIGTDTWIASARFHLSP